MKHQTFTNNFYLSSDTLIALKSKKNQIKPNIDQLKFFISNNITL